PECDSAVVGMSPLLHRASLAKLRCRSLDLYPCLCTAAYIAPGESLAQGGISFIYQRFYGLCARHRDEKQAAVRARAEAVCGDVQTLPGILLSFAIMATGRETIVMSMMWLPRDGLIGLGAC
ncbi:MAG: hypothetical protein JWO52_2341, partial [Gammaproteobacteria bacterium]|nr:hypothetical protein [Gammaproteobacteria bacterium]